MAPAAAKAAAPLPTVDPAILKGYMAPEGLPSNGSVPVYFHAEGEKPVPGKEGATHQLHTISYNFIENVGVAIIALNDVKSFHSLSPTQQQETFIVLEHAKRDPRVRAVVWTATGTKAFCSGAALKGDLSLKVDQDVLDAYLARGLGQSGKDFVMAAATRAFWDFPKPIIMAINGMGVGGGANMALANYGDVVFCSTTARFMFPFARLGVTPELGSSMVMPFLVGMSKAKEMMMAGEWFSAQEAKQWGLVSDVLEPEQLLPHAVNFAIKVAAANSATNRLMKQVLNATLREKLDEVLKREQLFFEKALQASPGGPLGNPKAKI